MKGKLYLGNIRNFKSLSEQGVKCFSITISKRFDGYMDSLKGLAPSSSLYNWHMANKDRENFNDGYYERYFSQVKNSKEAQEDINKVINLLNSGSDVGLICFCNTTDKCHRGIIGKWMEKKGYEVDFK